MHRDRNQILFIWGLVVALGLAVFIGWRIYTKPVEAQANRIETTEVQASITPEVPTTDTLEPNITPVNSADKRTIPGGVDEYGTPYPAVEAVPSRSHHRPDGFDNMCIQLESGIYTVAVVRDYDMADGWWPYLGEVDPATNSAANAKESEAWCETHKP